MRKILLLLFFLFPSLFAGAQFYEYGQDPASIKWRSIKSSNFKVIFPSGFDKEAAKMLVLLDAYYDDNSKQLKHYPGPVPVVLHNRTVISNGFAVWAPKRVEMLTFPDVHGFSQDWYDQLALHEFRHVVQVDKLRQGFTKIMTIALGEQGIGPSVALVPFWFLEGDAVYAETSLSPTGRGRLPSFEMGIKAQLLSDRKPYTFSKAYLGSYRDFVPDYYKYGYQMVSYARYKYGDDIWTGALDYVGRHPFFIDPMFFYLNRQTGGGKAAIYRNTVSYLKKYWTETAASRDIIVPEPLNMRRNRVYTSWNYPRLLPDSSVIAVKSGLNDIQRFVRIFPGGREKRLFTPGRLNSGRISVNGDRIVWDEFVPGLRWDNRNYSVLREYNYRTHVGTVLSRRSRLFSPAFSASGDTIVAVETTLENDFNLVFLSPSDGHVFATASAPAGVQLQDPAWTGKDGKILAIGVDNEGKKLLMYDLHSKTWKSLLPRSYVNISDPVAAGDLILFNGTYEGVDNIYSLDPRVGEIRRITEARFGAFEPSVDPSGRRMAWSDYSRKGYNLAVRDLKTTDSRQIDVRKPVREQPFFSYHDKPAEKRARVIPLHSDSTFVSGEYRRGAHLFHFHSWSPFWFDYTDPNIDNPTVSPGITLLSQNLLSTAVTSLGYEYRNGDHFLHTHFIYKGWVPVLDFSLTYGGLPIVNALNDGPSLPERVSTNLTYSLKSYVPLTFNTGRFLSGAQPSLELAYSGSYFYHEVEDLYKPGLAIVQPRLYFYSYLRMSPRDIQPRAGITLDGLIKSTPFEKEQLGSMGVGRMTLYLPGLLRHDGFKFMAASQRQHTRRYFFSGSVSFPRGYDDLNALGLTGYSLDYAVPVAYPDLDLKVLYIQRFRADLFADMIRGYDVRQIVNGEQKRFDKTYRSYGCEIYMDYHFFKLLLPVVSGVRLNYLMNEDRFTVEGIFTVNLGFF